MDITINDTHGWDSINEQEREMLKTLIAAKAIRLELSNDDIVEIDKVYRNEQGEVFTDVSWMLMQPVSKVEVKGEIVL